jgi:thiamine-monophosphate kinase
MTAQRPADGAGTLRRLGEIALIARLARRIAAGRARGRGVLAGIGDDAAVLRAGRVTLLFACDMLVEGVHFTLRRVPARWIGWKALACNVSDIAAMGGLPRWALVSLGLPPSTSVRFVDALYGGLVACAKRFGVGLVGGDTVRAPQVAVDVAILGLAGPRGAVLRRGAQVGDALFVTGRLGGSLASGRHARFAPRVREAQALLRRVPIHAMIDLSDGLSTDAWHLARAGGVTLRVEARRVPVARAARGRVRRALTEGEDFELLFAVPRRAARRVPDRIGGCPVSRIGRVIRRGAGVELEHQDGRLESIHPQGFRHF